MQRFYGAYHLHFITCSCYRRRAFLRGADQRDRFLKVLENRKKVEKLKYTHQNPVKRGLVPAAEEWRWSSYRLYALDEARLVRVNEGWREISFRDQVA